MKTIAIFNEKGGTGKTTLATLLADYLYYENKIPVIAFDMDMPSYHMAALRVEDQNILENKISSDGSFSRLVEATKMRPYPIKKLSVRETPIENIRGLFTSLKKDEHPGYCILDFCGGFQPGDPAHVFISNHLLDLLAIPVDIDSETRESAFFLCHAIRALKKRDPKGHYPKTCIFWNRIHNNDLTRSLSPIEQVEATMRTIDMTVLNTKVMSHRVLSNPPRHFGFVRQTMCYPKRTIDAQLPYLSQFFDELLSFLDN